MCLFWNNKLRTIGNRRGIELCVSFSTQGYGKKTESLCVYILLLAILTKKKEEKNKHLKDLNWAKQKMLTNLGIFFFYYYLVMTACCECGIIFSFSSYPGEYLFCTNFVFKLKTSIKICMSNNNGIGNTKNWKMVFL